MRKKSYRQPPILNACAIRNRKCKKNLNAPSMTPDEKSTLYFNEYHRFQTFKNQLQSKFQSLEDQLTDFIKKATKGIEEAKNKPQSSQLHADVEYRVYKKNRAHLLCLIISKLLKLIAQFWTCFKPRSFLV